MAIQPIVSSHGSELALVIGNGVNRYGLASSTNSWSDILVQLGKRHLPSMVDQVPEGLSLTEFYDILELQAARKTLQREFCERLDNWRYYKHHSEIVRWAVKTGTPVLTTNFDEVLSEAGGCQAYRTKAKGFTDFYPWEVYFGYDWIEDPASEFGIWHINGMQRYFRSVRLGLTHYMGSVQRARTWIHQGDDSRLFSGKNMRRWKGAKSWLHVIFNRDLLIFGLSLEENEVFLRWLLIERARYFKKFPERKRLAWYVYADEQIGKGKQFFLEKVGIKPVQCDSYDEIYGEGVWRG